MTDNRLLRRVVELLERSNHRIVFAESCTAGLISATLGEVAGVSAVLAGSAVVYQVDSKISWLGVDSAAIEEHGAVSQLISEQMAKGVLRITPHATIAASITGHLGPDAPADQDGTAWCSVATWEGKRTSHQSRQLRLDEGPQSNPPNVRLDRRAEAVRQVLAYCEEVLTG